MGTSAASLFMLSWSHAILCAGFMLCLSRRRVWITTVLWSEIKLLVKTGARTRVLSPNLIAFENIVLADLNHYSC